MAVRCNQRLPSSVKGEAIGLRRAAFAPPVLANWLPAVVLLAALFMPQVTGCDNLPVRPIDSLLLEAADQPWRAPVICWQHFYGLFVTVLFAAVLVSDREKSDRKLAFSTVGFWACLVPYVAISSFVGSDQVEMALVVGSLPLVALPSYLCYMALRHKDWISAWARLATSIAVVGMAWTFMSYVFNRGSRSGIFVTYGSLLLLAIAPWWLRVKWQRALISSSELSTPIRFRIWHLFAVSTLVALAYGYYHYVVPMFDG